MIHELIGINNNAVDLSGREEVPEDMSRRPTPLSADLDEFFRLNMYANFGEIGQTIQNLVKDFQEKKGHLQDKTESVSDLKEFISNYPEFKKISGTVSKHVTLVSELSKEVKVNNLLEISELEQTIACGDEKDNSISQLQKVLSLPNIRTKDALRLVTLYTMRYTREVERNLEVLCRSVKGKFTFPERISPIS